MPVSVKDIIQQQCDEFIRRVRHNMERADLVVSGEMSRSLTTRDVTEEGGKVEAHPYFRVLETGRKPGKFPPSENILEWVRLKGIAERWNMSESSAAYLVARSIAKNGSTLYRKGGRTDIFSNEIDSTVSELADEITRYYVGLITTEIDTIS